MTDAPQPPKVSDLRSPPVIGETYLVRTVRGAIYGSERVWPVLGPPHTEDGIVWDWHVDYRFITAEQEAEFAPYDYPQCFPSPQPGQRWPGSLAARQIPVKWWTFSPSAKPNMTWREWVCRRPTVAPERPLAAFPFPPRERKYGDPAPAVWTKDGRPLCPHQRVDLSQWPQEADGSVICPIHKLRVMCRRPGSDGDASG
jgi:hypothetical protein